MAETNTHNRNVGSLHQAGEIVDSSLAMGRVTGTVGDENTIEVLRDLVNGVVIGEDCDGSTSADQATKDVLLDTAVNQSNVERSTGRLDNEGSLGGDTLDQVDLAGINETLILVGIVLFSNGDPSQGRALLPEVGDNSAGINAGDGGNSLSGAPLAKTLDGSPMAVIDSDIGDNDTSTLNVGGLEVLKKVILVSDGGGNAIVANQGLSEDEDLASVGGVGHGLGVANKRGGEDGLTRDVGIGAESLALENRTVLWAY